MAKPISAAKRAQMDAARASRWAKHGGREHAAMMSRCSVRKVLMEVWPEGVAEFDRRVEAAKSAAITVNKNANEAV